MRTKYTFVIRQSLFAIATLLTMGSARADSVKSDYDHSANFSQIHTYSWGQVKTSDPLYVDRIKQEVNRDLQSKGWQMTPTGGDVTVFATGEVTNQQQIQTMYDGFGGGGWGGRGFRGFGRGFGGGGLDEATTTAVNQPVGHLVIDIFTSNTKNILWRGIIQRDVSDKADKNTKALDKDIEKLLKDIPITSK